MTLDEITTTAIDPALALLPARMDSPEARVMLLAIGVQQSGFRARYQIIPRGKKGKARGFWREEEDNVRGTMVHVAALVHKLCDARGVRDDSANIWKALETDDVLAAGMARLLLLTDTQALPQADNYFGAWQCYLRTWNQGKERLKDWPANHELARAFVTGDPT